MKSRTYKICTIVFSIVYGFFGVAGFLLKSDKLLAAAVLTMCIYFLLPYLDEFLRRRKCFKKSKYIRWAKGALESYKKNDHSAVREIIEKLITSEGLFSYADFKHMLDNVNEALPSRLRSEFSKLYSEMMLEYVNQHNGTR